MKLRSSSLGVGLLLFLLSSGCFNKIQSEESHSIPVLTKDEIARVDGRPFSIAEFLTLRSSLQSRSSESAAWIGIAALALQNETRAQGREIPYKTAIDISKYASREIHLIEASESLEQYTQNSHGFPSPEELKKNLDKMIQHAEVQKNPQPLSSFY